MLKLIGRAAAKEVVVWRGYALGGRGKRKEPIYL